jgi:hypothetical protein
VRRKNANDAGKQERHDGGGVVEPSLEPCFLVCVFVLFFIHILEFLL